jgi:hypothetical protein
MVTQNHRFAEFIIELYFGFAAAEQSALQILHRAFASPMQRRKKAVSSDRRGALGGGTETSLSPILKREGWASASKEPKAGSSKTKKGVNAFHRRRAPFVSKMRLLDAFKGRFECFFALLNRSRSFKPRPL